MDDTHKLPLPPRSQTLLDELSQRVIVADGAMGTMLGPRWTISCSLRAVMKS